MSFTDDFVHGCGGCHCSPRCNAHSPDPEANKGGGCKKPFGHPGLHRNETHLWLDQGITDLVANHPCGMFSSDASIASAGPCRLPEGHEGSHENMEFRWSVPVTVVDSPTCKVPEGVRNPKDIIGETKPPLHLVPPSALVQFAQAMKDGAQKYGPYNWRSKKVELMCYLGACLRHVAACIDREDIDPKSKVHHLAHAGACCAIALDALATGNLIDDRPPAGKAGDMIRTMTETK